MSLFILYLILCYSLYPISVQTSSGNLMHGGKITLGAMGDSFYEYLLKMWLYTGMYIYSISIYTFN